MFDQLEQTLSDLKTRTSGHSAELNRIKEAQVKIENKIGDILILYRDATKKGREKSEEVKQQLDFVKSQLQTLIDVGETELEKVVEKIEAVRKELKLVAFEFDHKQEKRFKQVEENTKKRADFLGILMTITLFISLVGTVFLGTLVTMVKDGTIQTHSQRPQGTGSQDTGKDR